MDMYSLGAFYDWLGMFMLAPLAATAIACLVCAEAYAEIGNGRKAILCGSVIFIVAALAAVACTLHTHGERMRYQADHAIMECAGEANDR